MLNLDFKFIPQVPVVCQSLRGSFLVHRYKVRCAGPCCAGNSKLWSPRQFESHAGGSANKWRTSLKVQPGTVPEAPKRGSALTIGR